MSVPLDFRLASQAVDFVIVDWRERMIEALDRVQAHTVVDQQAKAAAWFSFGFSAANSLFPAYGPTWLADGVAGHTVRRLLTRVALPIWIMSEAQKAFVNRHAEDVRRANETLFARHNYAKDQLVSEVQRVARSFADSAYGRRCANALVRHFQGQTFDDDREAETEAREILVKARLITTDRAALQEIAQEGFGRISQNVGRIFNGSPAAPRQIWWDPSRRQRLFYSASGDQMWVRWMGGPARTVYSDLIEVTDQVDALRLMANAHRMQVLVGSRVFPENGGLRTPITTVVQRYPHRRLEEFVPTFDATEEEIMDALSTAEARQGAAGAA